ncbi:branched-chain amino acid ABC transporter permease [Halobellus limi]|jgi:branched-chain amino acid transport system permease protein|uniref:Amino acid/amide ABC transporter membrane protein 1, HAAT family n=1 Tax=Halobellus limi TaxID=699433 RepID=A0A1H6AYB4_9EURY|nr:branched-chain amino acid ABC transporter permease [Halobellus limi]QCC47818.1 branched-chain amino acid ABC transporter permease [Halobellus limi]SEG53551.1 amino acid/amide ABC transporter membrane protein 1, HAAT family [Halobellus limi]
MVATDLLTQSVVNGLLLGGIYALAALGLSLVFGIMDIVNLAHGHMLMVGAYVAILVFAATGITPLVGMLLAMVLMFGLGVLLQKVLLKHVVDEGLEQPIIVLFGLALILQNLGRVLLGGDARTADIGIPGDGFELGFAFMSFPRTVTFVVSVLLIVLTWAFLQYTKTGQAIRATAQNRTAAKYMGINTDQIYVITLGIGTALAGAAGALLSMLFPIDPYVGWSYLLKTFAVVVLGGVGSVIGTLVGGLVLGVSENLGALYLGGGYRNVVSLLIFLVVLLVKPEGLFGGSGGGE